MPPDLWRSNSVASKLAGARNPLGRRGFLKLGAALTGGLALGAKPGHAEPAACFSARGRRPGRNRSAPAWSTGPMAGPPTSRPA